MARNVTIALAALATVNIITRGAVSTAMSAAPLGSSPVSEVPDTGGVLRNAGRLRPPSANQMPDDRAAAITPHAPVAQKTGPKPMVSANATPPGRMKTCGIPTASP